MRHFLILVLIAIGVAARATSTLPNTPVTLRKIEPRSGKEIWKLTFPKNQLPYRCEAYPQRVVIFVRNLDEGMRTLYENTNGPNSEVYFLDSKTGSTARAFDTRDFTHPHQDPLLAQSGPGFQGTIADERHELYLPNGWVSRGVGTLPWQNGGTNQVPFFQGIWGSEVIWTLNLPEGAYNLEHWNNILIFYRGTNVNAKSTGTLYGQKAGENSPAWEFELPADIPDVAFRPSDIPGPIIVTRGLSYSIGRREIFAYGGGTLMGLKPDTGKVLWRHNVAENPALQKLLARLDFAYVLEIQNDLILCSDRTLVRFDRKSKAVSVLREDLVYVPSPMVHDGFVYCFTARPRR